MSLINQMLKDLESRRTPVPHAQDLIESHSGESDAGRNRKLPFLLSLLVALLALIIAYLVWQRFSTPVATIPLKHNAMAAEPQEHTPTPVPPKGESDAMPASTAAPMAPAAQLAPAETDAGGSQLMAVEPQRLTGSWQQQRLTLKGRNLKRDSRIIVSWNNKRKVLPPQRVHWRDSNTLEVDIVTGAGAGIWSIALDDGQGEPLPLYIEAAEQASSAQQKSLVAAADDNEERASPPVIEKHIRPLSPEQLADKAYQEGYLLLQRGERSGAEKKWREALAHEPRHIASREGLAGLFLSQGRNVEAGELLAEGLAYHPGYGQFALLYARIQVQNGQPAVAIAALEKTLAIQAQGADFLAFLAALYQRQKDYDRSVAAYQRALTMQPRNSVWWMGVGISLEGAGKPQEALSAYTEARKSGNLPLKLLQYVDERIGALE